MTQRADQRICINATAHLQLSCRFFYGKISHHPGLSAPLQPKFGSLRLLVFPRAKIAVESEKICAVLLWFDSLMMIRCGPKHVAMLNVML
jgi:hypothetical protein